MDNLTSIGGQTPDDLDGAPGGGEGAETAEDVVDADFEEVADDDDDGKKSA